jgi:hypothetical protein
MGKARRGSGTDRNNSCREPVCFIVIVSVALARPRSNSMSAES